MFGIELGFYSIVVIIAIIILILLLTYVGILMSRKSYSNQEFPPTQNTCPDYWNLNSSSNNVCRIPSIGGKNTGDTYNSEGINSLSLSGTGRSTTYGLNSEKTSIDFSNASWSSTGITTTCAKKRWADIHGIIWDGVTNNNRC